MRSCIMSLFVGIIFLIVSCDTLKKSFTKKEMEKTANFVEGTLEVYNSKQYIYNNSDKVYNFGSSTSPIVESFTINNSSPTPINITKISLSNINFWIHSAPSKDPKLIPSGESTTFAINFEPLDYGQKTSHVMIEFKIGDEEKVFNFHITGTFTRKEYPKIVIERELFQDIPSNFLGTYIEGEEHPSFAYKIKNMGSANLIISQVTIKGSTQWYLEEAISNITIKPNMTHQFMIKFSTLMLGTYDAQINVHSNDPNNPSQYLDVEGAVTSLEDANPNIEVYKGQTRIYRAGEAPYDLGSFITGETATPIVFRIRNIGNESVKPFFKIRILEENQFDITQFPPDIISNGLDSNKETSFSLTPVTDTKTSLKARVAFWDDNEEYYGAFNVTAEVNPPIPVMAVVIGTKDFNSEETLFFESIVQGASSNYKFIIVVNRGSTSLFLNSIITNDSFKENFVLEDFNQSKLDPGEHTHFKVKLLNQNTGSHDGVITIKCNDPKRSDFVIKVTGEVIEQAKPNALVTLEVPEKAILIGVTLDSLGAFPIVNNSSPIVIGAPISSSQHDYEFKVTNSGDTVMRLGKVSVTNPDHFEIIENIDLYYQERGLEAQSFTTFTVRTKILPYLLKTFDATITFSTDGVIEDSKSFTINILIQTSSYSYFMLN